MKSIFSWLVLIVCWAGIGVSPAAETSRQQLLMQTNQSAAKLKQHLLVVYNRNMAESAELARYYAKRRGIPAERLLGLDTSKREEIDRKTFERTIWNPINAHLEKKGWIERKVTVDTVNGRQIPVQQATRNEVWAMVLMYGVPLKIKHDPARNDAFSGVQAANTNAASVDSELSTLPTLGLPISGLLANPYFFSGYPRPFDAVDARKVILVTRLDAPNAQIVRRMIDDSLYAEQNRLVGRAVFDLRGLGEKSNYRRGDDWIRGAMALFKREGWPMVVDNRGGLIDTSNPITEVGFYAGWYSGRAQAPFFVKPRRFTRGAIAYHLHSFSAESLRKDGRGRIWTGRLLRAGAAASMGTVYEPFLDFTPHIDVFVDRLTQHFTFAESTYMAQKALSWMTVMVGDPLYRPFALPLPEALAKAQGKSQDLADWLRIQLLQRQLRNPNEVVTASDLKQNLIENHKPSSLAWEGYADMLRQLDPKTHLQEVLRSYNQAISLTDEPIEDIRLTYKKAEAYLQLGRRGERNVLKRKLREKYPDLASTYGFAAPKPKKPASPKEKSTTPPRAIPVTRP